MSWTCSTLSVRLFMKKLGDRGVWYLFCSLYCFDWLVRITCAICWLVQYYHLWFESPFSFCLNLVVSSYPWVLVSCQFNSFLYIVHEDWDRREAEDLVSSEVPRIRILIFFIAVLRYWKSLRFQATQPPLPLHIHNIL